MIATRPASVTRCATWMCALVAALLVSCASAPPRSPEQVRADSVLTHRVYSVLDADKTYFYRHVNVRVENGVAHLSGYVWDIESIYHARELVARVPGVKGVVTNRLELEREGARGGGDSSY